MEAEQEEEEARMMPMPTTSKQVLPRYPIYIPSKGRADLCHTARALLAAGVPFHLVVEEGAEAEAYIARFGAERVLVLPFRDLGQGSIPARNWIWEHAQAAGVARHWCLDDNIRDFYRRYQGKRVYCEAGLALRVCEDFTDRYENIGIAGLNYMKFVMDEARVRPLVTNCHVYSCMLIRTDLYGRYRWRGRYNEDTDLCLQMLASGELCTVLLNTFLADKITTMKMRGGNTDDLYAGDGRLRMARSLERVWPGVVETKRRYHRPQHVINWRKFDTPLRLRPDVDLAALPAVDEYGMTLQQVSEEGAQAPRLQRLLTKYQQRSSGGEQSQAAGAAPPGHGAS